MDAPTSGLVEIVREFLSVDAAFRRLVTRYRSSELSWEEVCALVTDEEQSPLYRLKERSHALFRAAAHDASAVRHREVLFDLAIGSLFHEAMTFRENFYQREVYGPRVRSLREEAGRESDLLFSEFEKILQLGSARLDESVTETAALLDRCRDQLVDLISQHAADGHVARHLIERSAAAERVFDRELDALFAEVYGSPAEAWALAGRSYVVSGYFAEGRAALLGAIERGADRAAIAPWVAYADGISAYMRGDYARSLAELESWARERGGADSALVVQACAALSRVEHLVVGPDRQALIAGAERLVAELKA